MAEPAESAEKPHLAAVHYRLGKLETAPASHHRNPTTKVRSITRPTACIVMFAMNKPDPVAVRNTNAARHSEEPGAGIPHAGIFEGDAGQLAFLP